MQRSLVESRLYGARHGSQTHEVYCFTHGLPTKNVGSFMPSTGELLCGNKGCADLAAQWTQQVLSAKNSWDGRRSQECDVCAMHRARRCRVVGCSDMSPDVTSPAFVDAPFIHDFNAPKQPFQRTCMSKFQRQRGRYMNTWVPESLPSNQTL